MKIPTTFFSLLFITMSFAQDKTNHFKSEIDFGNGTVFSTFFDIAFDQGKFTLTSPKNADVRVFGGKARLGRILGKSPKKGIIITISGQQKKDSLFGDTNIPMVGKLKFKGVIRNKILSGEFISNDTTSVGTLHGVSSIEEKINYEHLYPIIIQTVRDNIYSKNALQSKEWENFEEKIEKLCNTAQDDIELFLGFNILSQQLPFTHLSLFIEDDASDPDESVGAKNAVTFEEKNASTAYLRIKNFSNSKEGLATFLPKIVNNQNYKNLIVDLRNNPGGGIDAAFEFAKHITAQDMEVGYFVTNKLRYSGYQPELFKKLPALQPKSTKAFTDDLRTLSGVKLIFRKPETPVFKGNIYVLTNGGTGSTSEPIVYSLKNSKRAVIVGETTAGAMLAATPFDLSGKYRIMVPIADFYTYDGVRLDKVGVAPNIEVKSEDALEKAMELINNKNN